MSLIARIVESIWIIPAILGVLGWMTSRVVAYFIWTQEQGLADFVSTVIPSTAHPSVASTFHSLAIRPMYEERQLSIRIHIGVCVIMGILLIVQLLPAFRTRFYTLHRTFGYIILIGSLIFITQMIYILFILGMVPMGDGVYWSDVVALSMIIVGLLLGMTAIWRGNVSLHRTCMMFVASAYFMNPIQRVWWIVLSKGNYGGPFKNFQTWLQYPTDLSAWLSIVTSLTVPIIYIVFVRMNPLDEQRQVVLQKKLILSKKLN